MQEENPLEWIDLSLLLIGGTTVKYAKKSIKKEIDEGNPVILGPSYFSYKGRPIAVASKEIEVIPLHLVSLISISSVLYAIPILL